MASADLQIVPVFSPELLDQVRSLLQEYWDSFGFTPCFQNFGAELAGLPGLYSVPRGRLAIAALSGQPAGCVALRPTAAVEACEVKRLFVRPAFRGRRIGRLLLDWVLAEARAVGYREMIGDTMPVMREAIALYRASGFEITPADPANPESVILLRTKL